MKQAKRVGARLLVCVVLIIIGLGTACEQENTGYASLRIVLVTETEQVDRNIAPGGEEPLQLVKYSIQGVGPNNIQLDALESIEESFIIGNLTLGHWSFTAVGYNKNDIPVAQGNVETVIESDMNHIEIVLDSMVGSGSFSLTCNWDPAYTAPGSTIQMRLTDYAGNTVSETSMEHHMDEGQATLSGSGISAGYYTVSVQLTSAGETIGGFVETVRIIDSTLTQAERTLDLGKVLDSVGFTIVDNIAAPVDGTLTVSPSVVTAGSSATLSFSPYFGDNPVPSGLNMQWYVDGTLIPGATESTYEIGMVPGGTTRYDIVVSLPESGSVGSQGIELHAEVEPSIIQ